MAAGDEAPRGAHSDDAEVDLSRQYGAGRACLHSATFGVPVGHVRTAIGKLNGTSIDRDHLHPTMSAYRRSLRPVQ